MAILVTGGAGYIGSVTVELLRQEGEPVAVIDDLKRGHRAAIDADVPFYCGSIGDSALIRRILQEQRIDSCIHFAALAYVGESVSEPESYFENNVGQAVAFFNTLAESGVMRIVFSSTCATYGQPLAVPISETHPQHAINPYGWSKFIVERLLEAYDQSCGLKYVGLRYFNAAGATSRHGEDHTPETHLIPNVLASAAERLSHITIFGSDYPTPDGTAVRDYIHVTDLARAHLLAVRYLREGGPSEFFNLGTGLGHTVLEVVRTCSAVTDRIVPVRMAGRRAGDPAELVARTDKARAILGWEPAYRRLDAIIRSAWAWHQANPTGYTRALELVHD